VKDGTKSTTKHRVPFEASSGQSEHGSLPSHPCRALQLMMLAPTGITHKNLHVLLVLTLAARQAAHVCIDVKIGSLYVL